MRMKRGRRAGGHGHERQRHTGQDGRRAGHRSSRRSSSALAVSSTSRAVEQRLALVAVTGGAYGSAKSAFPVHRRGGALATAPSAAAAMRRTPSSR